MMGIEPITRKEKIIAGQDLTPITRMEKFLKQFGGGGGGLPTGGNGLVVDLRGYTISADGTPTQISDISYDPIYEAIAAGQNCVFQMQLDGGDVFLQPVMAGILPGTGFMVVTFSSDVLVLFTNGSYHTTA